MRTVKARLSLIGAAVLLGAFVGLACASRSGSPLSSWDDGVTNAFVDWRSPEWSRAFWACTLLGDDSLMGPLAAGLVVIVAVWGAWNRAAATAGGMATGWVAMHLAKWAVGRARPAGVALIELPSSRSMPSGHALISVVFLGLLAYVLLRWLEARRTGTGKREPGTAWKLGLRAAVGLLATVLAIAVGLSRVYLGVHWMSDVIAGWCLGGAVLLVALHVSKAWDRSGGPERLRLAGPWRTWRSRTVVTVAALVVIVAAAALTVWADPLL